MRKNREYMEAWQAHGTHKQKLLDSKQKCLTFGWHKSAKPETKTQSENFCKIYCKTETEFASPLSCILFHMAA